MFCFRYSNYAGYFKLDSITGRLTVKRNLQELETDLGPGVPLLLRIIAQVRIKQSKDNRYQQHIYWFLFQEVEDAKSVKLRQNRLVDQISSVEIAIIIDDAINRPPRFLQSM